MGSTHSSGAGRDMPSPVGAGALSLSLEAPMPGRGNEERCSKSELLLFCVSFKELMMTKAPVIVLFAGPTSDGSFEATFAGPTSSVEAAAAAADVSTRTVLPWPTLVHSPLVPPSNLRRAARALASCLTRSRASVRSRRFARSSWVRPGLKVRTTALSSMGTVEAGPLADPLAGPFPYALAGPFPVLVRTWNQRKMDSA